MNGPTENEAITSRQAGEDNDEAARPTARYSVRVKGVPSETLLAAFPGVEARVDGGETMLSGPLPDQSALHGLLAQIEALGLELIELRRLPGRASGRASESAGSDEYGSSPSITRLAHPPQGKATKGVENKC